MEITVPADLFPKGPAVAAPSRRPGSVRRTSTIDSCWPEGMEANRRVIGRARDLFTPLCGAEPTVLAQDELIATVAPDRAIVAMQTNPPRAAVQQLVGAQGGTGSRGRVVTALPDEVAAGTPLYLLLDDLSGATLVGSVAFRFWESQEVQDERMRQMKKMVGVRVMEGICAGFQPGSTALNADGTNNTMGDTKPVASISNDEDPWAWHELTDPHETSHRRSRRIDLWLEHGLVHIEAFFQDSYSTPDGHREAVHEYVVSATADLTTGEVVSIGADPRVLPHYECPLATLAVSRMVGLPMREFRSTVNEKLPGIDGCTHMNDTLRSLAEVPLLAAYLN